MCERRKQEKGNRKAGNGEQGAGNGKQKKGNGEQGAGNGERVKKFFRRESARAFLEKDTPLASLRVL